MKQKVNLKWRVHTSELFNRIKEISSNERETEVIITPLNILRELLCEVAQRAIEIDDPKLNSLMCRMALYSVSDPQDADFNSKICEDTIKMGVSTTEKGEKS